MKKSKTTRAGRTALPPCSVRSITAAIVRDLLTIYGSGTHGRITRIAFKSGGYPGQEADEGGLSIESIRGRIAATVRRLGLRPNNDSPSP